MRAGINPAPTSLPLLAPKRGVGGADVRGGSGLEGLADRLAALDGRLDVTSPLGEGTTVTAVIPCA